MKRALGYGIVLLLIFSVLMMTPGCSGGGNSQELEKQLEQKQAEITELQKTIASLTAQIGDINKDLSAGNPEIEKSHEEIDALQTQLTSAKSRISELENEISTAASESPFQVGALEITSEDRAIAGSMVSINVTNTLMLRADYTVTLVIDGVEVEKKVVDIYRGDTQVFSFNIDRDISVVNIKSSSTKSVIEGTSDAGLPDGYLLEKKLYYENYWLKEYEITYLGDGLRIKGYLSFPNTTGKHPAIIFCRGGNKNYGLLDYIQLQGYSVDGYVAVGSQYRGNFGGQGKDEFGGSDVNDVINLIPLLKSLPEVDPNRIGIVGGSRGGMMAYMTLRHQTLTGGNDIKAAVIVSGSADLFYAAKDTEHDMLHGVYIPLIGGTPEQLPEEYEKRSAVRWANDINVPILIQHGDQDADVNIYEANEMAAELEKYGKVYKYIIYPGRGHDLIHYGQNWDDELAWLKKYLK